METKICEILRNLHTCDHSNGTIRFTTMVQAPSGSLITIYVRPHGDRWVVSDGGSSFAEAMSAGLDEPRINLSVRRALRAAGMRFSDGAIETDPITIDRVQQAAIAVSNLSRDIAESLIAIGRDESELSLDRRTKRLLIQRFQSWVAHGPVMIRGESEVDHKFDTVLNLPDGRKVLIDTVNHHRNSINSVVVANLDIKNLQNDKIVQRIVFDPADKWKIEDINLLKAGALPVSLPNLTESIERLAA